MTPRLILVGPPGAGKTSVGAAVAERIGAAFRDTDRDVETAAGRSITAVFVDDGEAAFRALERAAVVAALAEHDGVLAVGGGAVLDPGTRDALDGHLVVFLDVGLADAAGRVGLNRDRPLLLGNPRARLKQLMDERRPVYEAVASAAVDTAGRPVGEVVDAVLAVLAEQGPHESPVA